MTGAGTNVLRLAGVDEAGRGPLAGPVMAAAVILDRDRPVAGLRDSKKLTPRRRIILEEQIRKRAVAWSVAWCDAGEVDALNILQASLIAMRRAVHRLGCLPDQVLVDGNRCPPFEMPAKAVVGGDNSVCEISAASILAKVARDRYMEALHQLYPQYGFDRHKGYPTPMHLDRLSLHGASPQHRRSFAPVMAVLQRAP